MGIDFAMHIPDSSQKSVRQVLHPAGGQPGRASRQESLVFTAQKLVPNVPNILSAFTLRLLLLKQVTAGAQSFPCHLAAITWKASTLFTIS